MHLVPRLEDGRAGPDLQDAPRARGRQVGGRAGAAAVRPHARRRVRSRRPAWTPAPPPSAARLALDAFAASDARAVARGARRRPAGRQRRAKWAHGDAAARRARVRAGPAALGPVLLPERPIGPRRVLVRHRARMADIVEAKQRAGATVNDVCLAAVAGALRELALLRGEQPAAAEGDGAGQRARATTSAQDLGNRITFAFVELPVATRSRAGRLEQVHARPRPSSSQAARPAPAPARGARPAARPAQEPRRAAGVQRAGLQPHGLQHPGPAVPALHAGSGAERGLSGRARSPRSTRSRSGCSATATTCSSASTRIPRRCPRCDELPALLEREIRRSRARAAASRGHVASARREDAG